MLSLLNFLLYGSLFIVSAGRGTFKRMGQTIHRHDFVRLHQSADAEASHELIFAVEQKNLDELDDILVERSTPGSPLYQQWLSFDEVGALTTNPDGAKAVEDWLAENNIQVTWKSAHSDYIKASAKISQWEQMLDTKFFLFEDQSRSTESAERSHRTMHRALEYSLPEHVSEHLSTVFNTVQVPPVLLRRSKSEGPVDRGSHTQSGSNLRGQHTSAASGVVTVAFLNELYGMSGLEGNSSMSQAVFATDSNYFSTTDLAYFLANNSLPTESVQAPNGFSTDNCEGKVCIEGNLDTQFITGVAPGIQTVYWYVEGNGSVDPFVSWAIDAANSTNPPLVTVIAYGVIEQTVSVDVMRAFNLEAQKLTARGRTIIVSSGDNGAVDNGDYCETDSSSSAFNTSWTGAPWIGEGYFPSFPATSPFVTVVGATMGPETGGLEIACQSQLGGVITTGVITTGGGFSTVTATPSWQRTSVDAYLTKTTLEPGFNPNGRAYPDVALIGVAYQVYVQGRVYSVSGTSASAPVFAAMVGLVNTARVKAGKGPVGFMNPTLYAFGGNSLYFTDVDSGDNKCPAYLGGVPQVCCESGFTASAGWDPTTGFGSITYDNLLSMFMSDLPVSPHNEDNSFTDAEIGGIAAGCVGGCAMGAGLCYYFLHCRKQPPSKEWSTVRDDLPLESTAL